MTALSILLFQGYLFHDIEVALDLAPHKSLQTVPTSRFKECAITFLGESMSFNRCCCLFLASLSLLVTDTMAIWAAPGDRAFIKSRQDKFRDLGGDFKAIDDELKKRNPDWDNAIAPNAQNLQSRSSYLLTWFPKGSGPESGVKTYALPVIWQKPDDFNKLGKTAQSEAAKLNQIAASKDLAALKAQTVALGKACKACHDSYRSPDYEKENDE